MGAKGDPKGKGEAMRQKIREAQRAQVPFKGFVPGDLTDVERKQCKDWPIWGERSDDMLANLLDNGYTLSIKPDTRGGGYMAFITANTAGHAYAGWVLSGRGSTPLKSLKQACFRHYVMLDEVWEVGGADTGEFDYQD
jgi:hypothetical protein